MNIKILSDSTCDLTPALVERYDIGIVPLIVMKGDEEFYDGVTISPMDIFAHVKNGGALCSTAARSVGVFEEEFAKYAGSYDGVLHINIGSSFSSSYQNACLAAEEFDNVRVLDCASLSAAQGLIVLKACELSKTVSSMDELVEALEVCKDKLDSSFVVDQLDYLAKGGRCSSATALGANLLSLKPCIELKDNRMTVGKKYRGSLSKCLVSYIKDRFSGRDDIDDSTLMLVYSADVTEEILAPVRAAISEYASFKTIHECIAGCTISCHCGTGTLGVMFMKK